MSRKCDGIKLITIFIDIHPLRILLFNDDRSKNGPKETDLTRTAGRHADLRKTRRRKSPEYVFAEGTVRPIPTGIRFEILTVEGGRRKRPERDRILSAITAKGRRSEKTAAARNRNVSGFRGE